MNLCDVCSIIVAPARTGKTYYVTEWIATVIIPKTKKKIFTNCPIRVEKLAEYCHKKFNVPVADTMSRIHLIDRETETNWKNEGKVYYHEAPSPLGGGPFSGSRRRPFVRPVAPFPGAPAAPSPAPSTLVAPVYAGTAPGVLLPCPAPVPVPDASEPGKVAGDEDVEKVEAEKVEADKGYDERDEHRRRLLTEEQAKLLKPDSGPFGERDPYVFDGPWLYFWGKDSDLDGAIIILDEVHNFCGSRHCKQVQDRWFKFIGELGHKKAMLRCITQNASALGSGILTQKASKYCIENTTLRRIPFFKIQIYEIQMLMKAFLGVKYYQPIVLEEQRTDVFNDRKVNVESTFTTVMKPEIFELYDSFNKPIEGSQEKDENKKPFRDKCDEYLEEYGRVKGRLFLFIDFVLAHYVRLAIFCPLFAMLFLSPFLMPYFVSWTSELAKKFADRMKAGVSAPLPVEAPISLPPERPIVDKPLAIPQAEQSLTPSRYVDNEVIRRQVIAPKLCCISPDFLVYDDGMVVQVGDEFLDSVLAKIDYKNKKVWLKNGKKVNIVFSNYNDANLGGVRRQPPAPAHPGK